MLSVWMVYRLLPVALLSPSPLPLLLALALPASYQKGKRLNLQPKETCVAVTRASLEAADSQIRRLFLTTFPLQMRRVSVMELIY